MNRHQIEGIACLPLALCVLVAGLTPGAASAQQFRVSFDPPAGCRGLGPNTYGVDPSPRRWCRIPRAKLHAVILSVGEDRFPILSQPIDDAMGLQARALIEAIAVPINVIEGIRAAEGGGRATLTEFNTFAADAAIEPEFTLSCKGWRALHEDRAVPSSPGTLFALEQRGYVCAWPSDDNRAIDAFDLRISQRSAAALDHRPVDLAPLLREALRSLRLDE